MTTTKAGVSETEVARQEPLAPLRLVVVVLDLEHSLRQEDSDLLLLLHLSEALARVPLLLALVPLPPLEEEGLDLLEATRCLVHRNRQHHCLVEAAPRELRLPSQVVFLEVVRPLLEALAARLEPAPVAGLVREVRCLAATTSSSNNNNNHKTSRCLEEERELQEALAPVVSVALVASKLLPRQLLLEALQPLPRLSVRTNRRELAVVRLAVLAKTKTRLRTRDCSVAVVDLVQTHSSNSNRPLALVSLAAALVPVPEPVPGGRRCLEDKTSSSPNSKTLAARFSEAALSNQVPVDRLSLVAVRNSSNSQSLAVVSLAPVPLLQAQVPARLEALATTRASPREVAVCLAVVPLLSSLSNRSRVYLAEELAAVALSLVAVKARRLPVVALRCLVTARLNSLKREEDWVVRVCLETPRLLNSRSSHNSRRLVASRLPSSMATRMETNRFSRACLDPVPPVRDRWRRHCRRP